MISCSDAVKHLWEYLDGVLDEPDREVIEEHLSLCRRCCGELEFARELRQLLAASSREEIPEAVRARLTSTLRELGGE
jgi:mycothiol system anti-sigma-R factor